MSHSIADVGRLIGLIVHDLRNPGATIGANLGYVSTAEPGDPEVPEALADAEKAVRDLAHGLEQLAWIGRWLAGQSAIAVADGDVAVSVRQAAANVGGVTERVIDVEAPDALHARGGGSVSKVVEVLLQNSVQHVRRGRIAVRAYRDGDSVVVDVHDDGLPVAAELRADLFTLEAQDKLKSRSDARYSRGAGLLAARALVDALGATIEATDVDNRATFRVRLRS